MITNKLRGHLPSVDNKNLDSLVSGHKGKSQKLAGGGWDFFCKIFASFKSLIWRILTSPVARIKKLEIFSFYAFEQNQDVLNSSYRAASIQNLEKLLCRLCSHSSH